MSIPTVVLNEATPAGGDKIREGDDRIREFKKQVREILNVDHKYESSGQDDDMGKHDKVAFLESADLPAGAEGKPILGAQTEDGKAELVFVSEDNADVQLTKDGESIATETPDNSAPTANEDIVNKKYIDDLISTTAVENKVPVMGTNGYMPNDSVDTTALKTATGEVSGSGGQVNLILPGGEYGFYPRMKGSASVSSIGATLNGGFEGSNPITITTSYVTYVEARDVTSGTIYFQQRYITSSGHDHWIFLLVDKTTRDIISAYQAPDHPSYGNGGDPVKLPHPFGSYDETKHEIILLDKETCNLLKYHLEIEIARGHFDSSILTLVNEEYKPDLAKEESYVPLHSGKFLGQAPVMIETIPKYIAVRKLISLTQQEKDDRKAAIEASRITNEEAIAIKNQLTESAYNRLKVLGLTEPEIEALFS